MSRRFTRRSLLTATSAALLLPTTGCSRLLQHQSSPRRYHLESLEVVNAHDEPHEVLVFVTANGSARFGRSVRLRAANHGEDGVDSTNQWWERPVSEPARYRVHAKVDDRAPRTHAYEPDADGTRPSVNAVLWLDRTDGQLYFDTRE